MKGGGRGRSEPPSRQAACPERGPDGSPTWPSPPGNLKCERAAEGRGGERRICWRRRRGIEMRASRSWLAGRLSWAAVGAASLRALARQRRAWTSLGSLVERKRTNNAAVESSPSRVVIRVASPRALVRERARAPPGVLLERNQQRRVAVEEVRLAALVPGAPDALREGSQLQRLMQHASFHRLPSARVRRGKREGVGARVDGRLRSTGCSSGTPGTRCRTSDARSSP